MTTIEPDTYSHHRAIEEIVDILCDKTQNTDRGFFRIVAAYFLAKMAASMRATVKTKDRGDIPVNVYAVALADSGFGKGHSINILEQDFLSGFRKRFLEDTFPVIADQSLWKMAIERAASSGKTEDEEKEKLDKEFRAAGALAFTFDSGSTPAVKQMRQKLLMSSVGSINLQVDEIGSNLISNTDVLTVFLELFDQGMVKQKLTKNSADNLRGEELEGKTPTNALLFGTPANLFNGAMTEEQFHSFLEIGYARRCIFAWGDFRRGVGNTLTPAEQFRLLTQSRNTTSTNQWANHFAILADPAKYGWEMAVEDDVGIELVTYKIECEQKAEAMAEHEVIQKAEMAHRYYKTIKLAGALAFVDESIDVTMDHLHAAIKLVEESGLAFKKMMNREKTYVRLAKFIAAHGGELTHADLTEQLPYYKSGSASRKELMDLATSWGYKNHIIIQKRNVEDGIEVFSGETLQKTDPCEMTFCWSDQKSPVFTNEKAPFDKLDVLADCQSFLWANHEFENGVCSEANTIPGFNMVVLDVGEALPLHMVHELLDEYLFLTCTKDPKAPNAIGTRLILPINSILSLTEEDYEVFTRSVMEWLPFRTEDSPIGRARVWETFQGGAFHYNLESDILDPLPFIPRTARNDRHRKEMQPFETLGHLERWYARKTVGPYKSMAEYALTLTKMGMSPVEVDQAVIALNASLPDRLLKRDVKAKLLPSISRSLGRAA